MIRRLFDRGIIHPFGTEWDKKKKKKVLTSDQHTWIGSMLKEKTFKIHDLSTILGLKYDTVKIIGQRYDPKHVSNHLFVNKEIIAPKYVDEIRAQIIAMNRDSIPADQRNKEAINKLVLEAANKTSEDNGNLGIKLCLS